MSIILALALGVVAGAIGMVLANLGSNAAIKRMGDRVYPDYPLVPVIKERSFRLAILLGIISMYTLDIYIAEKPHIAFFHTLVLVSLFIADARDKVIPNIIVVPAFFIELAFQLIYKNPLLVSNMAITAIVFIAVGIMYAIGKRKGKAIGGGDVRVMLFLSLWQGIFILLTIPLASALALAYILLGKRKTSPFGPFLVVASLIVMSFGIHFVLWLFNLFF